MANSQPIESISFEAALEELDGIVRRLESGKAPLEESIADYQRGIELKQHCEKKLKAASMQIDKITLSSDGTARTEPFDAQ